MWAAFCRRMKLTFTVICEMYFAYLDSWCPSEVKQHWVLLRKLRQRQWVHMGKKKLGIDRLWKSRSRHRERDQTHRVSLLKCEPLLELNVLFSQAAVLSVPKVGRRSPNFCPRAQWCLIER